MGEMKEAGRYTIKDVANFAGMSTEAVRYYEKQGLISAEKNEENGYRYYKTWDIHMLMQARLYRQYGYSMNETKEMLQSKSVDALEQIFEKKKQELHENIVLQMRMLNYIKDRCSILHSTRHLNQNVCLEIRPEMFRFDIQNNYRLINDNSEIVNITQNLLTDTPFIVSSACFKKDDFINDKPVFSFGFSILKEFANARMFQNNPCVHHYNEALCVTHTAISTEKNELSPHVFQSALDYIYDNGLAIIDDVITNVVAYRINNNVKEVIHKIWIPVFNV